MMKFKLFTHHEVFLRFWGLHSKSEAKERRSPIFQKRLFHLKRKGCENSLPREIQFLSLFSLSCFHLTGCTLFSHQPIFLTFVRGREEKKRKRREESRRDCSLGMAFEVSPDEISHTFSHREEFAHLLQKLGFFFVCLFLFFFPLPHFPALLFSSLFFHKEITHILNHEDLGLPCGTKQCKIPLCSFCLLLSSFLLSL